MTRTQTLVQLNDKLLTILDQRAAQDHVSRSHLIREALEQFFAADIDSEISKRIVEGYEQIPQCTPDEWGALEEQSERSAAETARRLDAEEHVAGHDPW